MKIDFITIPIELLEKLAPENPINQDEQGGCIWCDWSEYMYFFMSKQEKKYMGSIYSDKRPETHREDCPWVIARKIIDDAKKIA